LYNTSFGKIGVICGGLSSEREVSLKSGHAIAHALLNEGFDVEEIDLKTEEEGEVVAVLRKAAIAVAFVAMHGRFGEDGRLQAILEEMELPYVGSDSLASAFAMNKIISKTIFGEYGIPTPRFWTMTPSDATEAAIRALPLPFVVKPCSQGSSIGISLVKSFGQAGQAFNAAFYYNNNIIIEEYIDGRELTVGILDNQALEPIEIVSKNQFFDFEAKYSTGKTEYVLPASLAPDIRKRVQTLAFRAHRALGCRHFSRVDILLDKENNPYVLEVNTIPGFTSTSLLPKAAQYAGISFSGLCCKLLELAAGSSISSVTP